MPRWLPMSDVGGCRVLVLDDEHDVRRATTRVLAADGYEIEQASDPRLILDRVAQGADEWDVAVLDIGLPEVSGIDVLTAFCQAGSIASVIMLTGDDTAATATRCMRAGAFHYLTKPIRGLELSSIVKAGALHARMRRELLQTRQILDNQLDSVLVGDSSAMRNLRAAISRLATQDVSVLIRGESGTGKELVARALHGGGSRRARRFVALNCGAIPETLIDSELFGHVKGAFTGATSDRAGVFVEAEGGTLFLDEIGDMPLAVQARLLRVLQEGELRPIGGSGVQEVDVRLIAATHVDLVAAVKEGRFRQDLFYRLNVVVLDVPPLRERIEDLPRLISHFLTKHRPGTAPSVAPDGLELMTRYAWPGNVRELENALLHALALFPGDAIRPGTLPLQMAGAPSARHQRLNLPADDDELLPLTESKRRALAAYEQNYLARVLRRAGGSVSEAARLAGIDRANLRRLLHRHGLDAASFKT